mgnify:CR=1 FL=1
MLKLNVAYKKGGIGMLSPTERKKASFSLLPAHNTDMRKYEEVYLTFANTGYDKALCDLYSEIFIDNVKRPNAADIIQLAALYERIHDSKASLFQMAKLQDKKLSNPDRFDFCVQSLKASSLSGLWVDAEEFRTANISFMQKYSEKLPQNKVADMYIALALADCAAKNYTQALSLLKFGYKPQGKNDTKLLEIFITAVYIFAKANDPSGLEGALNNANACLNMISNFEFSWCREYYEKRIEDASNGIF